MKIKWLSKNDMANIFQQFKDKNNNYVFNLNDTVTLTQTDTSENYYTVHFVKTKESYQAISYLYYNTTRLWWVITKFNNIKNVIDLPKPGTTLKILNTDIVKSIIDNIQQ